jgi:hypothetical protein
VFGFEDFSILRFKVMIGYYEKIDFCDFIIVRIFFCYN